MLLDLGVVRLRGTVLESHVLQFALAAGVAYWAVERVIAEQQLDSGFSCLCDLGRLGSDDHALSDRCGTGSLQFRHLLDANYTHAACGLQG